MNVFLYDNARNRIELNDPEILLVKEFKKLYDRDKTKDKSKLFRELTYMFLAIDWKSPYVDYTEQERHEEALSDASLTEAEFNDPDFRAACRKYRALQDSNKSIQLLSAAENAADQFIDYFNNIVDLNERDPNTGKPVFQAEKVMKEMSMLNQVHEQLTILKDQVRKELSATSSIRAGGIEGFNPGSF